jgi:hypothetical protein
VTVHLELLDEVVTAGRRLGRHIEHDARSIAYAVEHTVDQLWPPHAVDWTRYSRILDQGQLGSCTGNALTGWLACAPHVHSLPEGARYDEQFAVQLYELATKLDTVPGQYPPTDTGSTGLAVCKAARQLGLISGYGHALTVAGLLHALMSGPVIVGVPWHEGFDQPDADGMVEATGTVRGGHEFLVRGYQPGPTYDEGVLLADNSWGVSWGVAGSFRFTVATWRQLRAERADVTVPRV